MGLCYYQSFLYQIDILHKFLFLRETEAENEGGGAEEKDTE